MLIWRVSLFFIVWFWLLGPTPFLFSQTATPTLGGYVKYLPTARFSNEFDEVWTDQLLHNRLNGEWRINASNTLRGALRTRLFYGDSPANLPFFRDFIEADEGWVSLSHVWLEHDAFLFHSICDRLFWELNQGRWNIKAGRQRINWGVNRVFNPHDLFNVYSFFDFDYEEMPGSDALRVQYYRNSLSVIDMAYSPSRDPKKQVAALRYATHYKQYDLQWIGGYFNHRWVGGMGWSGFLGQGGFKGEVSAFYDAEIEPAIQPFNWVAALSFDYLFKHGGYAMVEYLYNPKREGVSNPILLFAQPLRADDLSFTDHVLFMNYHYAFTPVLSGGMALMVFPSERGMFASPNIRYSLGQNTDLMVLSQVFGGGKESLLSGAGTLFAAALKWSF